MSAQRTGTIEHVREIAEAVERDMVENNALAEIAERYGKENAVEVFTKAMAQLITANVIAQRKIN